MGNLAITYQHIADILSFETSNKDLEKNFSSPNFNWDNIVIHGSNHLVLPAIYCRLKAKKLLHVLPKELDDYLNEITTINRNRNKSIIKQINSISDLLNENDVEHVFLKGSALLTLGCYGDIAERMIGDLDILVKKPQLEFAFRLIKENGYDKTFGFAYEKNDFRHLDRLISPHHLASIELHGELLNKKFRHLLNAEKFLHSKVVRNGISTPCLSNLNKHQVLGWQLNDKGYYYNKINFKVLYDTILLKAHQNFNKDNDQLINSKYYKYYYELAKLYFKDFRNKNFLHQKRIKVITHKALIRFSAFRKLVLWVKSLFLLITSRLYLIKSNKSYRKHLYCKIFLPDKR